MSCRTFNGKVKSPLVFPAAYLVNQVLQTVTKIKVNECRLISPAYEKEHGIDEKCWGGFGTKALDFQNTTFDWFIPSERDVTFAVDFSMLMFPKV